MTAGLRFGGDSGQAERWGGVQFRSEVVAPKRLLNKAPARPVPARPMKRRSR